MQSKRSPCWRTLAPRSSTKASGNGVWNTDMWCKKKNVCCPLRSSAILCCRHGGCAQPHHCTFLDFSCNDVSIAPHSASLCHPYTHCCELQRSLVLPLVASCNCTQGNLSASRLAGTRFGDFVEEHLHSMLIAAREPHVAETLTVRLAADEQASYGWLCIICNSSHVGT